MVITLFFIDTARNILTYFETIRHVLKPGGKWINVGPLVYGRGGVVELGLDEVLSVLEGGMEFEFLDFGVPKAGEAGLGLVMGLDVGANIDVENGWGIEDGVRVRKWEARYGGSPRSLARNAYEVQCWVVRTRGS